MTILLDTEMAFGIDRFATLRTARSPLCDGFRRSLCQTAALFAAEGEAYGFEVVAFSFDRFPVR